MAYRVRSTIWGGCYLHGNVPFHPGSTIQEGRRLIAHPSQSHTATPAAPGSTICYLSTVRYLSTGHGLGQYRTSPRSVPDIA
eukprot:2410099-Rhodomonas_salina.1